MSGEDDTFEIDLYGDEGDDVQEEEVQWLDGAGDSKEGPDTTQASDSATLEASQTQTPPPNPEVSASPPPQQSLKRKAPDDDTATAAPAPSRQPNNADAYVDDRPLEPGAMPALRLAELHWWTTEEEVRAFAARAGVEDELQDVAFGEHKINGKSRGEVYMEFSSPQAASATKGEVDKAINGDAGSKAKLPFTVQFAPIGNPFKAFQKEGGGTSGVGPKKDFGNKFNNQQSGAYNQTFAGARGGRGTFHNNRGAFNNNRGGFNNNNNNNGNMQNGGGWGMQGNFGGNPMMAGFNNNMGGGFGMGRGNMNMMGNMMGRGGFGRGGYGAGMGGMNGMNPMNMGMMGGMMGMNFNPGMQQGGYGGPGGAGGGGGGYGDGNKRMRTE